MDIGKIHFLVQSVAKRKVAGNHVDASERSIIEELRNTPFLDRTDIRVFAQFPHMIAPTWEQYDGVTDYSVDEIGTLTVGVGGNDADGDWGTVKIFVYPKGVWLKIASSLDQVDNPYYEVDRPEAADAEKDRF